MKKENVETKNGGTISVTVFETLEEAIEKNGKVNSLKMINRMTRVDCVNEANRTQSLSAKVKRAIKEGTISEDSILAVLKKAEGKK